MLANRRRVLLVDDDPDIREGMRDILADEGYEMIEASDGQQALDYLRTHPLPPVVLLDWNMAPLNGQQFMTEVVKDPSLSEIPVILLTADSRAPEKSKAHRFAGYLVKPLDLDALFDVLARYCKA
jgi:CheY-like chemotaxis protein